MFRGHPSRCAGARKEVNSQNDWETSVPHSEPDFTRVHFVFNFKRPQLQVGTYTTFGHLWDLSMSGLRSLLIYAKRYDFVELRWGPRRFSFNTRRFLTINEPVRVYFQTLVVCLVVCLFVF